MTRRGGTVGALLLIAIALADRPADAQTAPLPVAESAPAPAPPKPATSSQSRYWVVGGVGFGAARAGCPECDRDGVSTKGRSLLVDAGFRATPRLDFGLELAYGGSKLEANDDDPILTTFVLGVVQVRPWETRGFFFKTGMGAGIVGNLRIPNGPQLTGTVTTNTLALVYGAGWVFKRERRFALQVHGTHHVAALGDVTLKDDTSIKNVLGNYWTVAVGIVFR